MVFRIYLFRDMEIYEFEIRSVSLEGCIIQSTPLNRATV